MRPVERVPRPERFVAASRRSPTGDVPRKPSGANTEAIGDDGRRRGPAREVGGPQMHRPGTPSPRSLALEREGEGRATEGGGDVRPKGGEGEAGRQPRIGGVDRRGRGIRFRIEGPCTCKQRPDGDASVGWRGFPPNLFGDRRFIVFEIS